MARGSTRASWSARPHHATPGQARTRQRLQVPHTQPLCQRPPTHEETEAGGSHSWVKTTEWRVAEWPGAQVWEANRWAVGTQISGGTSPLGSCSAPARLRLAGAGLPSLGRPSPHPLRGWGMTGTAGCWGQRRGGGGPVDKKRHAHMGLSLQTCARVRGADTPGEVCTAAECQPVQRPAGPQAGHRSAGTGLNTAFYFQDRPVMVCPWGRELGVGSWRDPHVSCCI